MSLQVAMDQAALGWQLGIDGRMAASNEDAPDIDGSNGAAIDIDGGAVPFGLAACWAPESPCAISP
jgi:hypothetical protein